MRAAFWAVLVELWEFVFPPVRLSGFEKSEFPLLLTAAKKLETLPSPPSRILIAAPHTTSVGALFITRNDTPCLQRPVYAFDTVLGFFSYGEEIRGEAREGQFVRVVGNMVSGWVDAQFVTDNRLGVYPDFSDKQVYLPDDSETVAVRALLQDECLGGELFLPLQTSEFVLYRLLVSGERAAWPTIRPRPAGLWQSILKGHHGVQIGIEPKTGAIMEYVKAKQEGVLALVTEVHPDNSIVIESVGMNNSGEYRKITLTEPSWLELRPVFILFN